MGSKLARITVLLPPADFDQFNAFCISRGHKKSTLIARLIREHLRQEGFTVQREMFPGESRIPQD